MNRGAQDSLDPPVSGAGAERNELDDLVNACLEQMKIEGDAAIDTTCSAHPEQASDLRLRIGALREAGLIEPGSSAGHDSFPEKLGEFRLLERLGGGGMGVVYLAEQTSLGRRVALKLIRPEQLYFPGARARFQREVEAVARLAHPNIVQVYTVGAEVGVPYFAMEAVQGASMADILRDRFGQDPARLSGGDLRASVERHVRSLPGETGETGDARIFAGGWSDVCVRIVRLVAEALEHAHRRGVLHRDIKPSNVMITPAGRVLLLDFGLATLQGTTRLTRTGSQLGSLPYMSPEQLKSSAGEVGISADMYSLGVTLYEMLSLRLPFEEPTSDLVLARILEGRPTSPRDYNKSLAADAATVCLTAMDVEPARRYASAEAFARDLTNVLEKRPIEAHPVGVIVRARRWIQRHPGWAAAGSVGLIALTAGPILFALQERGAKIRIEKERDIADANRIRADANFKSALDAIGVLTRVGEEDLKGVPQAEDARSDLLESALRFYKGFLDQDGGRGELRFETACALLRVGEIDTDLGRNADAKAAIREAIVRMEDIVREHPGSDSDPSLAGKKLAGAHALLGDIARRESAPLEAEAELVIAEKMMTAQSLGSNDDAESRFRLASVRGMLGDVKGLRGEAADAERMMRESQAIFVELAREFPDRSQYVVCNVKSSLLLGALFRDTHRSLEAKAAYEEALRGIEALHARNPGDAEARELLAIAHSSLAIGLYEQQSFESSAAHGEESARLLGELIAEHPKVGRYYDQYFATANNIANAYGELKQPERGLTMLEDCIARVKRAAEALPDRTSVRQSLELAEASVCTLLTLLDRSDEAYERLSKVIPNMQEDLRAAPANRQMRHALILSTLNLVDLSMDRGRHAEAAGLLNAMPEPSSMHEMIYPAGQLAYCCGLARGDENLNDDERAAAVKSYEAGVLAFLDHAIESGFADVEKLESNKDFDEIRANPEFQARVTRVRARADAK